MTDGRGAHLAPHSRNRRLLKRLQRHSEAVLLTSAVTAMPGSLFFFAVFFLFLLPTTTEGNALFQLIHLTLRFWFDLFLAIVAFALVPMAIANVLIEGNEELCDEPETRLQLYGASAFGVAILATLVVLVWASPNASPFGLLSGPMLWLIAVLGFLPAWFCGRWYGRIVTFDGDAPDSSG